MDRDVKEDIRAEGALLLWRRITLFPVEVRDYPQAMGLKAGRDKKAALDLSQRWRAAFFIRQN
jgi:hypothetical protein